MAAAAIRFPAVFVVASLLAAAASAAHSAPAPAADCSSLVMNMVDCLSFVSAGSKTEKPEGTCCSGLKTVLKTDAECLCEAFRNSAQLGVTLNVSKALTLPTACHVSAPSVSNCGMSVGNGPAPALSPSVSSPSTSTVSGSPNPTIGANEAAPTPAPGGSTTGSSPAITTPVKAVLLAMVAALSLTSF